MRRRKDTDEETSFRPSRKPLVIAIVANAALAFVFLGAPYLRGMSRAESTMERFGRFAACMFGGRAAAEPGLALPPGETDRFASLVMGSPPSWPERCRPALRMIPEDPALFLMPWVKQAEATVALAVRMVDREVAELARARARARRAGRRIGRVPTRPLAAISRLQAALSVLAEDASASGKEGAAIVLRGASPMIQPARAPLHARDDARTVLRARGDGAEAVAVDGRGIATLRVGAGAVTGRRIAKPALVRAAVWPANAALPVLLWAIPEERCAADRVRCARHAAGIAALEIDADHAPDPIWLGGHPAIAPERAIRLGADRTVDLVALGEDGASIVVRRFALPERLVGERGAAPLPPAEEWTLEAMTWGDRAALVGDSARRVVWTVGAGVRVLDLAPAPAGSAATPIAPRDLAVLSAGHRVEWIEVCEAGDVPWLAYGGGDELAVARLGGADPAVSAVLRVRVHAARARAARLVCEPDRAQLFAVTRERGAIAVVSCDASAACATSAPLVERVVALDAVRDRGRTIVAFAGMRDDADVRTVTLDDRGRMVGTPRTHAACWDNGTGFCGAPLLAARSGRVLLAAHEGADLLVLESLDSGVTWRPLSGIR